MFTRLFWFWAGKKKKVNDRNTGGRWHGFTVAAFHCSEKCNIYSCNILFQTRTGSSVDVRITLCWHTVFMSIWTQHIFFSTWWKENRSIVLVVPHGTFECKIHCSWDARWNHLIIQISSYLQIKVCFSWIFPEIKRIRQSAPWRRQQILSKRRIVVTMWSLSWSSAGQCNGICSRNSLAGAGRPFVVFFFLNNLNWCGISWSSRRSVAQRRANYHIKEQQRNITETCLWQLWRVKINWIFNTLQAIRKHNLQPPWSSVLSEG